MLNLFPDPEPILIGPWTSLLSNVTNAAATSLTCR